MSVRLRREPPAVVGDETPFPWLGMLILAGAIFVCVTSEFLPTGLLPQLSEAFSVSESQVGMLVTIFAGSVVVSAPILTALTRRVPRKTLVIAVLVLFAITNLLIATATDFTVVVIARVLGGVAHGLFWSVVGAYSPRLVPARHLARAIAVTGGGGTAAFVLGVPIGTALGNTVGWQLAFVAMAVVIALLVLLVALFLPPVELGYELRTGEIAIPARKDPSVFAITVLIVIVTVVMVGQYSIYTYIVPFMTDVIGLNGTGVSTVLFVYGIAGAVGLVLVSFVAKRYPRSSMPVAFGVVTLALALIGFFPNATPAVIGLVVVWSIGFACGQPLIQTRLLQTASPRVRDQASAWMTVGFNVGIGAGAFIGGGILDSAGLQYVPFAAAAILAFSVLLIVATDVLLRRRAAALA